jgi:hypothetical protein
MRPNERLEQLVEAAFGERPLDDLGTLSRLEETRLVQLASIARALSLEHFEPPMSLLESVKAFFPGPEQHAMRLVSTNLMLGAARGTPDVLHAVYEHGDETVRAMFTRTRDGWRVMGQAPPGVWSVVTEEDVASSGGDGRFEVATTGEEPPSVLLIQGERALRVTPPDPPR